MAPVIQNLPANSGDMRDPGSIPGPGRSPGWGHSNPLQYSCLENPMDRGAWQAIVHGVAKSWTRLSDWTELNWYICNWITLLYTWNITLLINYTPIWASQVASGKASAGGIGVMGSISGLERSTGEGTGNPLQYSCLENPMDRGAWQAIVHRVKKSQTWLKRLSMNGYSNIK